MYVVSLGTMNSYRTPSKLNVKLKIIIYVERNGARGTGRRFNTNVKIKREAAAQEDLMCSGGHRHHHHHHRLSYWPVLVTRIETVPSIFTLDILGILCPLVYIDRAGHGTPEAIMVYTTYHTILKSITFIQAFLRLHLRT